MTDVLPFTARYVSTATLKRIRSGTVKTGERVHDMFRATDSKGQPCCCVLVKSPDQVGR